MPLFAICYLPFVCALVFGVSQDLNQIILKAHHRCGPIAAFFDQAR